MLIIWTAKLPRARSAIFGLAIAWAFCSCSEDSGKRGETEREFSSNPAILRLLEKSRATVQKERGLRPEQLAESHFPKYVETRKSACIIWFPTPLGSGAMVLDDRMTYVTCLGSKEALSDPMEYNEYRE